MRATPAAHPYRDRIREFSSSVFNYWFGYVSNLFLVCWLIGRALGDGHLQKSAAAFAALARQDVNWGVTSDLWDRVFRTKV